MTLEPTVASAFIAGYKELLLQIADRSQGSETRNVLSAMASARQRLVEKPALLDEALAELKAQSRGLDDQISRAVRTLRVDDWVFLRDTKTYSIFLHPSGDAAFAVLGLTERLRDIAGSSGVVIKTGIFRIAGRFVCDGLITRIVHLGPNYRKSYSRAYSEAKAEGRFHVRDEA